MYIVKLKEILKSLSSLNIKQCVFDKNTEEDIVVRGVDSDLTIGIIHNVNYSVPKSIYVEDTSKFLSNLDFFDEKSVYIDYIDEYYGKIVDNFLGGINIKDNKSQLIYNFVSPERIIYPKDFEEDFEVLSYFTLNNKQLTELKSKVSSMKNSIKDKENKIFILECSDNDINLKISNEDGNFLSTNIAKDDKSDNWSFVWNLNTLLKLLQTILKRKDVDEINFSVTSNSLLFVNYSDLEFFLLPEETL